MCSRTRKDAPVLLLKCSESALLLKFTHHFHSPARTVLIDGYLGSSGQASYLGKGLRKAMAAFTFSLLVLQGGVGEEGSFVVESADRSSRQILMVAPGVAISSWVTSDESHNPSDPGSSEWKWQGETDLGGSLWIIKSTVTSQFQKQSHINYFSKKEVVWSSKMLPGTEELRIRPPQTPSGLQIVLILLLQDTFLLLLLLCGSCMWSMILFCLGCR